METLDAPRPVPDGAKVIDAQGGRGEAVPGAGALGMWIFLGSLTMLFLGSIVAYLVVRLRADQWRPDGAPSLPASLWGSTLVIVACSFAVHRALTSIRRGNQGALVRWLWATTALGAAFLGLQVFNWWELVDAQVTASTDLYGYTFYMLTGLHALHVVGGFVPLGWVIFKARRRRYTWASYGGVRSVAMYWHFLDAVWVVLFAVLVVGS